MEYALASTFDELLELFVPWGAVIGQDAPSAPITVHPEWVYGLWFLHASDAKLRVLSLWEGSRLLLAFPYVEGTRRFATVRLRALCEIVPCFCAEPTPDVMAFLFSSLARLYGRYQVQMEQVDLSYPAASAFVEAASQSGKSTIAELTHANVVIDLSGGWDDYWNRLSANTKEGLRKARARIASAGVTCCFQTLSEWCEVVSGFDRVLAVDSRSWKHTRGGSMSRSAYEYIQIRCALEKLALPGRARVYLLELNHEPAAFILAALCGSRSYFAFWSYADPFSYFMPGKLLMAYALEEAAKENIQEVDLWGRHDRFKASWSKTVVNRYRFTVYPRPAVAKVLVGWRRFVNPVWAVIAGPRNRYRLRVDKPGLFETAVLWPVRDCLRELKIRYTATRLRLREEDREASSEVSVRRAVEEDKWNVGPRPPGPGVWFVFEGHGERLGAVMAEPLASTKHLLIRDLRFLNAEEIIRCDCLAALLIAHPETKFVYTAAAGRHRRGSDCAVRLIEIGRSLRRAR